MYQERRKENDILDRMSREVRHPANYCFLIYVLGNAY